jgi:ribosomal protein S18 acetylase RimI-like enzyme
MDLRELAEDDLHILVELCRGGLRDAVSPAVLRRLLCDGPGDLAVLQLGLWDDGRLVGAALGGLRALADGLVGGPRLLVVAPTLRGRGLGTQLMDALEGRLRAAGVVELRVGTLAPNYLWPGLDPRDTAALCLFERRGYTHSGDAVNMGVVLAGQEWWGPTDDARLAATGWAVRRATPADAEALAVWVHERFGELWAWEARAALALDPPAAFVAVSEADAQGMPEGRIGGFACHSVSGLPGTFGPTGTDPALRGAGLGRALLRRCLADLQAQGYAEVEIGWVGPVSFYSRAAGASISRVCWFMRRAP